MKEEKISWSNKFYILVVVSAFISLFFVISYTVLRFTSPDYLLCSSIFVVGLIPLGLMVMSKLRLPGDKKDLD